MLRTDVIHQFLSTNANPELAHLYNADMECQVNVAQDGGERVEGDWQGHHWTGWRADGETWKSFRIPWKANATPEYIDRPLKWSTKHIEAVGMTGWDWKARCSRWVGFDFDAVIGHVQGLTATELDTIKDRVSTVEWVTVRRSKGGLGLHLYVFLDPPVPTENHNVHAALARAILSELSGVVGHNLASQVDKLGGNLWVWHRETKPQGFSLVKAGTALTKVPENWKDHAEVVEGKHHKVKPPSETGDNEANFEEIVSRVKYTVLDQDHLRVIDFLRTQNCFTSWDSDRNMLVTHTIALKKAHETLKLKGIFYTISEGKGGSSDKNCYMFPIRGGAWVVRRFSQNAREHSAWQKDANGWTRCLFNHPAELAAAAAAHDGVEDEKGAFVFKSALKAMQCLKDLGGPKFELTQLFHMRQTSISGVKGQPGKVLLRVVREETDNHETGWLQSSRPKGAFWQRVVTIEGAREEPEPPDQVVRHVVSASEDAGWFINSHEGWMWEPRVNVNTVLKSQGFTDIDKLLGLSITNPWVMVSIPFKDEYPGGRRWNRGAAQLGFSPKEGPHPTWDMLLGHVFSTLTPAVLENPWCKRYGIASGADYGKCWTAALFQEPTRPLPYLFFVGPQKSGKSTFHEALRRLFADPMKGVAKADQALRSRDAFNGELVGRVLAIIEEVSLKKNKEAYNRIKDLVTGETIAIHFKGKTIYDVNNTLHFIQCANSPDYCPVEVGDTRIVMIYVDPPEEEIPKHTLMERLVEEAPHFLHTILKLEIPPTNERLRIPVVETGLKEDQARANRDELTEFLEDVCTQVEGEVVQISKFYEAFFNWLPLERHQYWNQRTVKGKLPARHPTGRYTGEGQIHIGNLSLVAMEKRHARLERRGDRLCHVDQS
jgi:hypothetical protein